MDYCNGGSVAAQISKQNRLPAQEAVDITLQALDGLRYAHQASVPYVELADGSVGHSNGLVHRDLKPDNLFLVEASSGHLVNLGKDPWGVVLHTRVVPIRQRAASIAPSLAHVIDQALDDKP